MSESTHIEHMGTVYAVADLQEEARRERESADRIEQYNAAGAQQARRRAERIERVISR